MDTQDIDIENIDRQASDHLSSSSVIITVNAPSLEDYWNQPIREDLAAEFLGYEIPTLRLWRREGRGPKFIRVSSRSIRYRRRDLRDWLDRCLVSSTSDPGNE